MNQTQTPRTSALRRTQPGEGRIWELCEALETSAREANRQVSDLERANAAQAATIAALMGGA